MARRFWRSNAVPWALLATLVGVWARLPAAYAAAGEEPSIPVSFEVAFLLGLVTAVAGAALGYGMALQKLRSHCDDEQRHFTMETVRQVFMPREEVKLLARSIVHEVMQAHGDGDGDAATQ